MKSELSGEVEQYGRDDVSTYRAKVITNRGQSYAQLSTTNGWERVTRSVKPTTTLNNEGATPRSR